MRVHDVCVEKDFSPLPHDLAELLSRVESAKAGQRLAPLAMLDGAILHIFGARLCVFEAEPSGAFRCLYRAGGAPPQPSTALEPSSGAAIAFGRALRTGAAIFIDHASIDPNAQHGPSLIVPMMDTEGREVIVACRSASAQHADALPAAIADAAPDAMLAAAPVYDEAGQMVDAFISFANIRAGELAGVASSDLVGTPLSALCRRLGGHIALWQHLHGLQQGRLEVSEVHRRIKGASRWLRLSTAPFVHGILITINDVSEQKRALIDYAHQTTQLSEERARRRWLQTELRLMAEHDALTGLAHEQAFYALAVRRLDYAAEAGAHCAMLRIAPDRRGAGEADGSFPMARRLGELLGGQFRRDSDVVARLSDETFAAFLFGANTDAALAVAERLRKKVEEMSARHGDQPARLTICIGIALHQNGDDLQSLLDRSAAALSLARRGGANRVATELRLITELPRSAVSTDSGAARNRRRTDGRRELRLITSSA